MTTGPRFGAKPAWYDLVRASRLLKIPPWELARQPELWMGDQVERLAAAAEWLGVEPAALVRQPRAWIDWALMAASAEAYQKRYEQDRLKAAGFHVE